MRTLVALVLMLGVVTLFAVEDDVAKSIGEIAEMIKTGKNVQALERSTALAEKHPKHLEVLRQLLKIQTEFHGIDKARPTLERMMVIAPNDTKICNQLAIAMISFASESEPRYQEAVRLLIRATEIDPKDGEPWYNLAMIRATQTNPDLKAAREAYGRSIKLGVARTPEFEKKIGWQP